MTTETITVRETLSNEQYETNKLTHNLMYKSVQLLLDYIHHTQKERLISYRRSCTICGC